jgi:NAD(P)H dehydrogenase (quinone)
MFAVMGITGQVGGAIANSLLQQKKQVRAIVRNPEKASQWRERGAEIAIADYDDADALQKAFTGAEGVFAMIPPNFAPTPGFVEQRRTITALHNALSAARPGKVAYLSSIGSEQTSGLGLITSTHLLEEQLATLPIPSAFLRAGWFMENTAWDIPTARDQGKLFSYLHPLDRKYPMVATADIGQAGANVLLQQWSGNRYIEVAGPQQYSPLDIARELGAVVKRNVETVLVPRTTWVQNFVEQGTPEDRTAPRVEMIDGFNSGWIHFNVPGTEHYTGTTELKTVLESLANNR